MTYYFCIGQIAMKFKEFVGGFSLIKFKQVSYHGLAMVYRELILEKMLKHEQLHEWEITDQNIDQLMNIMDDAPIIDKFFQDANSEKLCRYDFDFTKWDEYKLLIKTLQAANLLGVIRLYLDSFGLVCQFSVRRQLTLPVGVN